MQQCDRTYVLHGGRKLSYFSGCDYFRLSSHPRVRAALVAAVRQYGLSVSASRMTTGNHVLFGQLEARLREFFAAPAVTLTPTGYVANFIAAQALAGQVSHALLDAGAHASLADATRFLDCPVVRFPHRDAEGLRAAAAAAGPDARLLVVTDGLCARDGSAAPLADYLKVVPKTARFLVDDAHGAGVLGAGGQGTWEHAGIPRGRVIQTITLSKAFGAYGGAVLTAKPLRGRILGSSMCFVGSTPPPLPLVAAALESVRLLAADPRLRERLAKNRDRVKNALRAAGLPVPATPGPMFGLFPRTAAVAGRVRKALEEAGIFPPFIHYPGAPRAGYFRFVISSEHTSAQLDNLVEVLAAFPPADFIAG